MPTDPIRQAQIGTGTSAVTYNIGTSLTSSSNADVAAQGHTHTTAETTSKITAVTFVSFSNGVLTISTDSVAKGDHTHSVNATTTTKVTAAKSDHTH